MVQQVQLAHMPPELALYLTYYRNVKNAAQLRQYLLDGNSDFEYAFVDASIIVSRKHVLAAAFRAMNDYLHDRLKSRNVHSEIVFALNPNNNIGEAFRRFGIQESTTNIIVLKVATNSSVTLDSVTQHLSASIEGEESILDESSLEEVSDIDRIKKVYKLSSVSKPGKHSDNLVNGQSSTPAMNERHGMEVQVLGIMAVRGSG